MLRKLAPYFTNSSPKFPVVQMFLFFYSVESPRWKCGKFEKFHLIWIWILWILFMKKIQWKFFLLTFPRYTESIWSNESWLNIVTGKKWVKKRSKDQFFLHWIDYENAQYCHRQIWVNGVNTFLGNREHLLKTINIKMKTLWKREKKRKQ